MPYKNSQIKKITKKSIYGISRAIFSLHNEKLNTKLNTNLHMQNVKEANDFSYQATSD